MASQVEASFWRTIHQTSETLSIEPSTALILLLHYNWDVRSLVGDYNSLMALVPILDKCPQVVHVSNSFERCSCCNMSALVEHFNCGHFVCGTCCAVVFADQLRGGRFLMCPAVECGMFINYENLPRDLMARYLDSSLQDYTEKTVDQRSPITKFLDILGSQKKKIAGIVGAAVLGFNLYRAKRWMEKHPIKTRMLRFFVKKFF